MSRRASFAVFASFACFATFALHALFPVTHLLPPGAGTARAPPVPARSLTRAPWTPFRKKPSNVYNTGQAVCGGKGCVRACMVSLEKRNVLTNKFHSKFRRRAPWSVAWEGDAGRPAAAVSAPAPAAEKEPD